MCKNNQKEAYIAPESQGIALNLEGVIAASNNEPMVPDFLNGGPLFG